MRMEREEYVQEKLTAEEFQRKTNKPRELTSYEAGKIKLADGPSMWQQLVARDFRFDSGRYFPREMVRLDLSSLNPQWQILAANDLRREAQKGHQSLKEKYRETKKSVRDWFVRIGPARFYCIQQHKIICRKFCDVLFVTAMKY